MIEKFKSNAEAIATADKYLYGNHARMPIVMDRGEGCWVWDLDNNKYLDFVGGIAVNGLGHHHPAIVEALDRAKDMMHCSNYYYNARTAALRRCSSPTPAPRPTRVRSSWPVSTRWTTAIPSAMWSSPC